MTINKEQLRNQIAELKEGVEVALVYFEDESVTPHVVMYFQDENKYYDMWGESEAEMKACKLDGMAYSILLANLIVQNSLYMMGEEFIESLQE